MVDFAGWEMPVQYAGPLKEHMAVRTRAGIFDVSHMGEIEVRGGNALKTIQRVTCNDAERLPEPSSMTFSSTGGQRIVSFYASTVQTRIRITAGSSKTLCRKRR